MQAASAAVLYFTSPIDSPLAIWITLFAGSLGNLAVVGPWTTKFTFLIARIDFSLMNVRHRLEKSSGTKYTDDNITPEMKALNTKFAIAHGMLALVQADSSTGLSSLLNLGYFTVALAQILYISDSIH